MLLVAEGQRPPLPANLPAVVLPKATAVAAESTAAGACFLRPSFVYIERAAIEFAPVESRNRAITFAIVTHLDKSKAPGPSGFAVRHDVHPVNGPVGFEHASNGIFGRAEAEVSYKYILQVIIFFLRSTEQLMKAQDRADFRTIQES